MPVDQRRINGPEVSVPYHIYSDFNKKSDKVKHDFSKRSDKRIDSEIRKICKIVNYITISKLLIIK